MNVFLLLAAMSSFTQTDSLRLKTLGRFTLPAGAEITAMSRYDETSWIYDAGAGKFHVYARGRTAEQPAVCKGPDGAALTGAWFTAYEASLAFTVEGTLWVCDVRTQKALVAATLKALPARIAAFDGMRIAYSSMSGRFRPQVSIVDLNRGSETAFAIPEAALPHTPGPAMPFFPFTLSSGRVVVGDPFAFALRYIDAKGTIVHAVERPMKAIPYTRTEAKRLAENGTPASWTGLGRPLFTASTMASDGCGNVWTAIRQPDGRSWLNRSGGGRESSMTMDGEVVKLFLSSSSVMVAVAKGTRTHVIIYALTGADHERTGSACDAGARTAS